MNTGTCFNKVQCVAEVLKLSIADFILNCDTTNIYQLLTITTKESDIVGTSYVSWLGWLACHYCAICISAKVIE